MGGLPCDDGSLSAIRIGTSAGVAILKAGTLQPPSGDHLASQREPWGEDPHDCRVGLCLESPVPVLSPTLYAELHLQTATTLLIPTEHEERALYVLSGEVQLDGEPIEPHSLVVLPPGKR